MIRLIVHVGIILAVFFMQAGQAWSADTPLQTKTVADPPLGVIESQLLPIGYSGHEKLVYDVSWTGGIKIGELTLEVNSLPTIADGYEIRAAVSTKNGALNWIYPLEDLHVTKVKGAARLPYYYEIWQQEGYRYRAHRVIEYHQQNGYIRYMKNDRLDGEYYINGETNNEFSAFFNSRLMPLVVGSHFIVPTFADKRRVKVVVNVVAKEKIEQTAIGPVTAVAIMPVMTFRGLYDKRGDTVIWYTDDECRVPVRIHSKIVIGSLTAELRAYKNPACTRYQAGIK
ncbi:DUF3108 domain-containing protein [Desulfopila sp. IMCC35006]|uniref:DUF3108 domain-containing protein n=1 Tax=Desulfopila sp. IMCC35006 TaxID=2569542 RepID=UPI0010ABDDCB|nr:DUF3108 domain-containing protein [Desulfopila sp. IMCC35006]TKB27642.1 DUF3108 domain-containing protein [Desulfopila sp. IMCC35006]